MTDRPERRTVLDTSVVVSALLLPTSVPRRAFDAAAASGALLVSAETIAELHEVLRRPKFERYLAEEKRLEFLAALLRRAELIKITEVIRECRDAKDDKVLELAVSGSATHVVTGDADLLVLHPFREIAVLTPQQYVELARDESADSERPV